MKLSRQAEQQYSGPGATEAFYLRMRRWLCPLDRIVEYVPRGDDILDVGCGSGLFARMMALQDPLRRVLGIDPDPGKIRLALKGATPSNLVFEHRQPCLPRPSELFDVITLVDVLYLVPLDEQRSFLTSLGKHLRPGGSLLIKGMDTRRRAKLLVDLVEEFVAVRLIRMTQGHSIQHAPPETYAEWLASDFGMHVTLHPIDRGYPHPHLLIAGRMSSAPLFGHDLS